MKCKTCKKVIEDGLIECPHCHVDPRIDPLAPLTDAQLKAVTRSVGLRLLTWILTVGGAVSLVTGFSVLWMYQASLGRLDKEMSAANDASIASLRREMSQANNDAIKALNDDVKMRIAKEFEQETVKTTIREVAGNQASSILRDEINPTVERFQSEVSRQLDEVRTAEQRIRTLDIEVTLDLVADWKDDNPPDLSTVLFLGGGSWTSGVVFTLKDGRTATAAFHNLEGLRCETLNNQTLRVRWTSNAEPGATILGELPSDIVSIKDFDFVPMFFSREHITSEKGEILMQSLRFFSNGKLSFVFERDPSKDKPGDKEKLPLKVPEKTAVFTTQSEIEIQHVDPSSPNLTPPAVNQSQAAAPSTP